MIVHSFLHFGSFLVVSPSIISKLEANTPEVIFEVEFLHSAKRSEWDVSSWARWFTFSWTILNFLNRSNAWFWCISIDSLAAERSNPTGRRVPCDAHCCAYFSSSLLCCESFTPGHFLVIIVQSCLQCISSVVVCRSITGNRKPIFQCVWIPDSIQRWEWQVSPWARLFAAFCCTI